MTASETRKRVPATLLAVAGVGGFVLLAGLGYLVGSSLRGGVAEGDIVTESRDRETVPPAAPPSSKPPGDEEPDAEAEVAKADSAPAARSPLRAGELLGYRFGTPMDRMELDLAERLGPPTARSFGGYEGADCIAAFYGDLWVGYFNGGYGSRD